jgi:hypothetical protein
MAANDEISDPLNITETITVRLGGGMVPSQMALVMRKIARLANAVISNITADAATSGPNAGNHGVGHPIAQMIVGAAAQAEAAAANLEGPSQIARGPQIPPGFPGMGRA